MALWYIDALDARAGMGFATYRDADLHTGAVDLGKPAVFIGPPFFQGESVASRAIGFAATRGSFQFGLFVDSEEVAFSTLQGVCEFIRRAYLSAGGGDTDSGISPAPVVPNPEPEGGGLPPMEIRPSETPFVRAVLNFASLLQKNIGTIPRTKQLNTREGVFSGSLLETLGPLTHIDDLLAYGAAVLIDEMMRRVPNEPRNRGAWIRSTMKLGQLLGEFGLLHSIFTKSVFQPLWALAGVLEKRFRIFNTHVRKPEYVLPMILGIGPFYSEYLRYGPPPLVPTPYATRIASDPMDDLSSFAIPSAAAKYVGLTPTTASARDLLSVVLADPTLLLGRKAAGSPGESVMIVAIILLSSVRITSVGRACVAPIEGTALAGALLEDLVTEAIVWMDSQLPAYLFNADVEGYIRGASQLRYAPLPTRGSVPKTTKQVSYRTNQAER